MTLARVAKDFGIHEVTRTGCARRILRMGTVRPGTTAAEDEYYLHDGHCSTSWQMARPRGVLFAESMKARLEPGLSGPR